VKNNSISVIRVIAMLSIIFGHYCTMVGINLYQFGGIGVEIFLFISGYLYSNKEIESKSKFIGLRIKKLVPPIILSIIPVFIFYLINDGFSYSFIRFISHGFCVSGLNFLIHYCNIPFYEEMAHLWFVTIILLCYLLLIFVKKANKINDFICNHFLIFILLSLGLIIGFNYIGIQFSYIFQFLYGFYAGLIYPRIEKKRTLYIGITFFSLVIGVLRIILRKYIDGTVLYDDCISPISFNIISIWIIMTISLLCNVFKNITAKIVNSFIWRDLERKSYIYYIVHYQFVVGCFSVYKINTNSFLILLLILCLHLLRVI